jgi:hypothetical protein
MAKRESGERDNMKRESTDSAQRATQAHWK